MSGGGGHNVPHSFHRGRVAPSTKVAAPAAEDPPNPIEPSKGGWMATWLHNFKIRLFGTALEEAKYAVDQMPLRRYPTEEEK